MILFAIALVLAVIALVKSRGESYLAWAAVLIAFGLGAWPVLKGLLRL